MFAIASIGLLLFGLLAIRSTIILRREASQPMPGREANLMYGDLYPGVVEQREEQWVVVAAVPLRPGDRLSAANVVRRSAFAVIADLPELKPLGGELGPNQVIFPGTFEDLESAVGKYVTAPVGQGLPIAVDMTSEHPEADPLALLDMLRRDRMTIAMPPEPTLYPLLRPGDRVDIMIKVDHAVRRVLPNVRVLSINNLINAGDNVEALVSQNSSIAAAAEWRRRRLLAKGGGEPAAPPPPPPTEDATTASDQTAAEPPADAAAEGEQPADANLELQGEGAGKLPAGVRREGRKFDGRTLTVQVSREEALALALSHRNPAATLDFALRPKRRGERLPAAELDAIDARDYSTPAR